LESIELAHKSNRPAEADAIETARNALNHLPLAVLSHGSFSLTVLPDGRLASGGADGNIKLWPKDGTGAPVVLHERQRVRLRDGDNRAWHEILEALDGSGLDPDDWFPIPPGIEPYPGLVAFDEKDAGIDRPTRPACE
jgi:hypothetical protein